MPKDKDEIQQRAHRIEMLSTRLSVTRLQIEELPDEDNRKKWIPQSINALTSKLNFWEEYLEELTPEDYESWDKFVDQLETDLLAVENSFDRIEEQEKEEQTPMRLPTSWREVLPEVVYVTATGLRVRFGKRQIRLAKRYDSRGKHLKAIENGRVATEKDEGLVPSQEKDYLLKSKALGSAVGHHRFHAYLDGDVLYFPGKHTNYKR